MVEVVEKSTFTALMALFLILPVFATIARFLIRLRSGRWHRASWDDGFVLAATICLFTEGTMTLVCRDQLFVLEIYYLDPWNSVLSSDISLPTLNGKILAANCLVWTSIFAIKMSFMALFYGLIWNISRRLKWYYVFVVVLTTLTWFLIILQVIIESTILCPAFADEAYKCPPIGESALPVKLWLRLGFDLGTDLAIISIPLCILSASRMKTAQKIRVAALLCLPLIMVIVTIVRAAAAPGAGANGFKKLATIWNALLLHVEAGVAILMASVVVLRGAVAELQSRASLDGEFVASDYTQGGFMALPGTPRESKRDNLTIQVQKPLRRPSTVNSLFTFFQWDDNRPIPAMPSPMSPGFNYHDFIKGKDNGKKAEPVGQSMDTASDKTLTYPTPVVLNTHGLIPKELP